MNELRGIKPIWGVDTCRGYVFNRVVEIIVVGGLGSTADFITEQLPGSAIALAGGVLAYSAVVGAIEYDQEVSGYLDYGLNKLKN